MALSVAVTKNLGGKSLKLLGTAQCKGRFSLAGMPGHSYLSQDRQKPRRYDGGGFTHAFPMLPNDFIFLVKSSPPKPEDWVCVFAGDKLLIHAERLLSWREWTALAITHTEPRVHGRLRDQQCWIVECPAETSVAEPYQLSSLRSCIALLSEQAFMLAGRAFQLVQWQRSHRFCGRCGTATLLKDNEHACQCPACGLIAYPRVSPAMMVLVTRAQEILLARAPHFPPGMYSALAGFVEPGESLEQCVVRETREETGVEIKNLQYFSSQSWPFPHSLMLAFSAEYVGGELTPEPGEIEDLAWFRADNLPNLPPRASIARRLIDSVLQKRA